MTAYEETLKDLVSKLKELFQMDQADLDFGIYRVMKAKHDEIDKFLTKDLLPTVKKTLEATGKSQNKQKELDEIISNLRNAGIDPDTSPKVQELKALLENGGSNSENDAKDIFSNLITFFSRYYSGGDFMSLRRYKKDTYSPLSMNGEEVKLHWANADQYYIKSSENLTNYAFVDDTDSTNPLNVKFVLVAATTEQNNNKSQEGERVFTLASESPFEYLSDKNELSIKFEYQVDAKKRKQKDINANIVKHIEKLTDLSEFPQWPEIQFRLLSLRSTKANPKRTLIEKHLIDFTAKNKFDYFIHKDLGGFLNKELDYFIKSELVKLDDIIPSTPTELNDLGLLLEKQILTNESQLKKVIALKSIAQKIIQFLAQLEDFQKKLWLKKKFVLNSNYCFTLDLVNEKYYEIIINCKAQIDEWKSLYGVIINSLSDLANDPYLIVDTKHFSTQFKMDLLCELNDIDLLLNGELVNSENFGAINLLSEKYKETIKTVYIDPPYNTDNDGFLYKDGYSHSSWMSFMADRVKCSKKLLSFSESIYLTSIDKNELFNAKLLMDSVLDDYEFVNSIVNVNNPKGRSDQKHLPTAHENILFYAKDGAITFGWDPQEKVLKRYNKSDDEGRYRLIDLRKTGDKDRREDRPNMFYFFYFDKKKNLLTTSREEINDSSLIKIQPMKSETVQGRWRWQEKTAIANIDRLTAKFMPKKQQWSVFEKDYLSDDERVMPTSVWDEKPFNSERGTELFVNLGFPKEQFKNPKPVGLLEHLFEHMNGKEDIIMDFFAGTGTTGQAIINLNRKDRGNRKYLLAEMGEYFDDITKSRIKKSIYSHDWDKGKPLSKGGISQAFKYLELESYDDVLSNIDLSPSNEQQDLLSGQESSRFNEQYTLQYMLDIESKNQLINPKLFESPLNAEINVVRKNQTIKRKIDLIETFNYLLGLNVETIRELKGIVEVVGKTNSGEKCLILWRDVFDTDNNQLDEWFKKQDYNSRDMEFDLIYVNGDNNLPNLKTGLDHWKVQLIDTVFYKLMFDVNEL